jgi:hypothetical protein
LRGDTQRGVGNKGGRGVLPQRLLACERVEERERIVEITMPGMPGTGQAVRRGDRRVKNYLKREWVISLYSLKIKNWLLLPNQLLAASLQGRKKNYPVPNQFFHPHLNHLHPS